jgi:putative methyltransferase (TIGR04325 family)
LRFAEFAQVIQAPRPVGAVHESENVHGEHHWAHGLAMTWAYVLQRAAHRRDHTGTSAPLKVLDWGSGLGHSYLLARTLWPELALAYHAFELPQMVLAARAVLPDVEFYDDREAVFSQRFDLVIASGAMHYDRDWKALLQRYADMAAPWLYITRLPTTSLAASYVFMQRVPNLGYDTEYAGWCINHAELIEAAQSCGLRLEREFLVDESAPVHGAAEPAQYRGFLFYNSAFAHHEGATAL